MGKRQGCASDSVSVDVFFGVAEQVGQNEPGAGRDCAAASVMNDLISAMVRVWRDGRKRPRR
jgi:hypothetical protein